MAISEAGFAETRIRDVQMLFAKPGWSGPPDFDAAGAASERGSIDLAES